MINYTRQIGVKHNVDVCVVGCGPAGFAAAVSAARNGTSVLVIDALSMPGGMSTAALVPVLMPVSDGINFLAGGIGHEMYLRAQESGAMRGGAIHAEKLKYLYEDMMTEAGVAISYNTTLMDVDLDGQRINAAICHAKSGLFAIQAKIFIDCSGDGDLAALAGAPFEIGDDNGNTMPATLCSLWAGVDWNQYREGKAFSHNDDNMLAILKQAYEQGVISMDDYHHTGMTRTNDQLVTGNFSHVFGINPLDELSVTKGLIDNRKLLREYEKMYRQFIKGFQNASLATSGSILGIRESRRIIADYVLTAQDYDNRATFEDEIGRYNFSIDVHPSTPGRQALEEHKKHFRGKAYGKGESYGIPYRILCPKNTDNLLVAGRCVSTDRNMMASLRVIPGCWITGMAAGTAAAISVKNKQKPNQIDVKALQKNLHANGAFLPNFKP